MRIDAYCTSRELPALSFPHTLYARRDRTQTDLPSHLDQLLDALLSEGQEMTGELYALLRHIQRTAHHLTLEIEEKNLEALSSWLESAHGVMRLPDESIRDTRQRILFHPRQAADKDAALPVSETALLRRSFNHRRLKGEGLSLPEHLPTVLDEDEVILRSPAEVAQRALGLFLVALRAESVASADPIPVLEMQERQPLGYASLTPAELAYIEDSNPPEQATVEFTWRYESLNLLLWSLGVSELPPIGETCDVAAIVGLMMEVDEQSFIEHAGLRLPTILLDALDLHYRYHWIARKLLLEQEEHPAHLNPGVALERHHALNWLVSFEDAPWDEIDTPT